MKDSTKILQKIALGLSVFGLVSITFVLLPITPEFIVVTKTYLILLFSLITLGLFAIYSIIKKETSFVVAPYTLALILLGLAVLASSLFSSNYPVEHLLNMGGVFLASIIIALIAPSILPSNSAKIVFQTLTVSGVLLTLSGVLELLGFGPSRVLNQVFALQLPSGLIFSLTGSALITLQIILLAVIGGVALLVRNKKIEKFNAITLPILIIGVIIYAWALLPGKDSSLNLPPATAGWSVALDVIRTPKQAMIGVGPSYYSNAYLRFKPLWMNGTSNWNVQFNQASLGALTILTTSGILGLIFWLMLIFKVSKDVIRQSKTAHYLGVMIVTGFVMQFFLPMSSVILAIQVILLAAYTASELKRFSLLQLKASAVSTKPSETSALHTYKNSSLPQGLLTGLLLILVLVGGYFVARSYGAQVTLNNAAQAAEENDGVQTYLLQQKAVQANPYLDSSRRQYALTNLAIASALANKTDLTEEEQQQVGELLQQAVREARAATTLDPNDFQNWLVLATIYNNMIGVSEDALQWATQAYVSAIENNPTDPSIRIALGGLFLNQEDYSQAASIFSQAVNVKPDFPNAHYNLAVALVNLGQLEQAATSYNTVLSYLEAGSDDFNQVTKELEAVEEQLKAQADNEPTQGGQNVNQQRTITDQNLLENSNDLINTTDQTAPLNLEPTPGSATETTPDGTAPPAETEGQN